MTKEKILENEMDQLALTLEAELTYTAHKATLNAMDTYAKQVAIGFAEWISRSEEWDFNGDGGYHNMKDKHDAPASELYDLYLKSLTQ